MLAHLVVLLGGEAGLRCGESMGLEWSDIDFAKRQLTVARSEWKGHVTMPKGGRRLGDRDYARFRAIRSPAISASFFARVHRFSCRSRPSALSRVSCASVKTK